MKWRKREEAAIAVTHWDVISNLMQIDPPPAMGDSWLDGVHDGVYQAQCYLKGRAQGQAMNGDYSAAVETAKIAVALNAQRSVTSPAPQSSRRRGWGAGCGPAGSADVEGEAS